MNKFGWRRTGTPALGAFLAVLAFLLCASNGWSIPDGKEQGLGNLLALREGDTGAISRTYDGLNRVTSYTEAGRTIGYRYYPSGRLAKLIYPGGSETGPGHVEYLYDAEGRLYQVIDRLTGTARITTYRWNADGKLASVARPNGTTRTIGYDSAGRPATIADAGFTWALGYYPSDEIASLDVTPGVPASRLRPLPAANMSYDAANRLTAFNGQSVRHDADGNMVEGPLPLTGASGSYSYDSRNRLTGAGGLAYRYNAEGNRVGIAGPGETTTLTVDPNGALPKVLERVKNGIRTRYVYGAGLQYEVNEAGAATYYHYDQSGNTAALTDQAGVQVERLAYSPYGLVRYRQGNFDTPFLYGGFFGVMTDGNGLINMRARYYHPLTMRFLTSDPAMDGLNWYAYANGNPINFADPTGYGASKVLDAIQGGLSALGFVPGLGALPDLLNAGISAARGNYVDAMMNAASAVPGPGDLFAAGKVAAAGIGVVKVSTRAVAETAVTAAKVEAAAVKTAKTTAGVRQAYVAEVRALEDLGLSGRAAGQNAEATARMLHAERNALKVQYRELSPADRVKQFEQRNIEKYGNSLGPTIEQLRGQGKTWEQIIDSASRPGGGDLGF